MDNIVLLRKDIEVGLLALKRAKSCPKIINCLWELPLPAAQECSDCPIAEFRRKMERESPAFWGLYKKFADYDGLQRNRQQGIIRLEFAKASIFPLLVFYSVHNKEVPYISQDIIRESRQKFSAEKAVEELKDFQEKVRKQGYQKAPPINIFLDILSRKCLQLSKQDAEKMLLLLDIFVVGINKERKTVNEQLFSDIERFLKTGRA